MSKIRIIFLLLFLVITLTAIYLLMPAPSSNNCQRQPSKKLLCRQAKSTRRTEITAFDLLLDDVEETTTDNDDFASLSAATDKNTAKKLAVWRQCIEPVLEHHAVKTPAAAICAPRGNTTTAATRVTSTTSRKSNISHQSTEQSFSSKDSTDKEDMHPYLLWRQLLINDNDTVAINLLLCGNLSNSSTCGAIVGQVIPENWEVASTYPEVHARDMTKREIKWLFANILPGTEQMLQIILRPVNNGDTAPLTENSTFYRCRLPSGKTAQFSCCNID